MTARTTPMRVEFVALGEAESRAMLASHHVARLAYSHRDRVDIEPIHYSSDGDWIFGRTSMGTKLATLSHHPWCALEVDDFRGLFDWSSVVVKGTFYLLDPEASSPGTYARALEKVQALLPEAFGPDDPAPHRTILFGIHVNEVTGRSARTRA